MSRKNKTLRKANTLENLGFIDLSKGYRTRISFFRISLLIGYLVYFAITFELQTTLQIELVLLFCTGFVIVFLLSVVNIKTFFFYPKYFIVGSPFNFFNSSFSVHYSDIKEFRIYKALYNSNILKLELKNGEQMKIQFAGCSTPRNDYVVRVILNTQTNLKKDFAVLAKNEQGSL